MPAKSASTLLSEIAKQFDGRYPGMTGTIAFDLGSDGIYRLVVQRGACHVEAGPGEAQATLRAREAHAVALLTGDLDPTHALQNGKVEVEGNYRLLALLEAVSSTNPATHDEPLLSPRYPAETLSTVLLPRQEWHPYPVLTEREAWEGLPQAVRKAYIAQGEEALEGAWPQLTATRYLEYARVGNRSRYQDLYHGRRSRLGSLVLAECMEGEGRFLDEIANGIWLICEESSWCYPAHVGVQRAGVGLPDLTEPIVDLFAAETSALLSWTDYLVGEALDAVSPLIRPRVHREIDARILTPCLDRDDFWWMGFMPRRVNNWNPWINSNWLTSALVVEADPERRAQSVAKSMRSIDRFVGPYPRDGGCDEGPGYWGRAGASLLDCLELLYSASQGRIDIYREPLVQEIGRFIYRVQIESTYFVNFADASAIVTPAAGVVYRYGQRIGDAEMMALGAWLLAQQEPGSPGAMQRASLGRTLPVLFSLDEMASVKARQPLPRDAWLHEVEIAIARDRAGSSDGLFLAAKGGHNAESHNHNDVGNFVVYVNGKPVLVDAGVETYTRKTFSPQRYEIWTMQSGYHSLLPTIDGVMQAPGRRFAARDAAHEASEAGARFSLDIAGAYPPEAKIASWVRTITLERGRGIEVADRYELTEEANEIVLSLVTPCTVDVSSPGKVVLSEAPLPDGRQAGSAVLTYDGTQFSTSVERVPITDERLGGVWGTGLNRIVFAAEQPPQQGSWTFAVARSDGSP